MASNFYFAREARQQASMRRPILNEIQYIENGIADAIEAGELSTEVGPESGLTEGFTNNEDAYDAWSEPTTAVEDKHNVLRFQMNEVISHFTKLGYRITRTAVEGQKEFNWSIKW